ncbi:MAG TPA: TRAP transporter substrate-binding protein DctP [Candidatus Polarisedimenticolaceae bacterium]|nr:TRAP transporter substrate-binding protein DctP [Candidatus Polarisedimenticolaceae bacterium]
MRTIRCLALAAAFVLAIGTARAADTVVVKMATLVPAGSAWNTSLTEMGQKWQQVSGGKVTLKLYAGGVAGDDADVVRKIRLGTLNAGFLATSGLADIDRGVLALQIPMLFEDYAEADWVADKITPALEAKFDAKGFVVLSWIDAGWAHFFTKTPARSPDELKTAKLFAWAGDDKYIELWKGAGFHPIPLPATEISTALGTGLVNAICTTPQIAALMQWYTSAKNMTDVNWALLIGGIVIDKNTWNKIPADVRPAIIAATKETARRMRDKTRAEEAQSVDAMKSKGLIVVKPTAADLESWRKLPSSVYPLVRGAYMPADDFDLAVKSSAEYRAQKPH